jgi:antitoxin (DNA-binding transcriptional repressor) of toxin-antitoxin stability system
MTTTIDVQELPARFAEIYSLAESGTEVIVTEGNIPRARLVPLTLGQPRIPGLHRGAMIAADDFDAPLDPETLKPLLNSRDDWEQMLLSAGTDCGVSLSHEAVSSEGLYD